MQPTPVMSATLVPEAMSWVEKGGVLAFAALVLGLLWYWKREQAHRDERHIAASEKQAKATEDLASAIATYAAAQANVATELRELTGEVRLVRDGLREVEACEVRAATSPGRRA